MKTLNECIELQEKMNRLGRKDPMFLLARKKLDKIIESYDSASGDEADKLFELVDKLLQ